MCVSLSFSFSLLHVGQPPQPWCACLVCVVSVCVCVPLHHLRVRSKTQDITLSLCVSVNACVRVCVPVCVRERVHVRVHARVRVLVLVCVCVCTCVFACVHMCECVWGVWTKRRLCWCRERFHLLLFPEYCPQSSCARVRARERSCAFAGVRKNPFANVCEAIESHFTIRRSVRFAGLLAGLKLAGHSPARCHARMPRKQK